MDITGVFSGLFAAVVVGVVARIITPGTQAMGCLLTLLIGLVGAALGLWVGSALDWGGWLTFGAQVLFGALLALPFSVSRR